MTPEYKAEKAASVSHLGGGGIWEINFVSSVAPVRCTCFPAMRTMLMFVAGGSVPVGHIANATELLQAVHAAGRRV